MERFTSSDGTGIAYQVWGEPSQLPPVVLHHGFVVDATTNFVGPGVVDALVAAGRQVVALDARGHGASDKPHEAERYGEAVMARDLGVLLDTLGAGEVDLVGYSMGAVVSAIFAAADPRVRRLVLSGVGAGVAELGGLDTRVMPPAEVTAVLLTSSRSAIEASPAAAFRLLADAVGADRAALAAQVSAAHRTPIALDRITAPTLVLVGQDDALAARPEVLAAAIPGARWRIVSGDHMTALRAPAYAPALVKFLAG
ncbi:alpha/beta hydrolase [Dactylosporangium sp. NBC_01737]|uniref:alpha/beta fold hydrolase n=1 Tax=Dactylosporangium sp. NBC_01737 TaxID=2975959 RepID=UPI002E0D3F3B|nr:alpha/beta hydrolase [Dactylosporangium sp. NBC_01737]